jgi:hypothetical protein
LLELAVLHDESSSSYRGDGDGDGEGDACLLRVSTEKELLTLSTTLVLGLKICCQNSYSPFNVQGFYHEWASVCHNLV